MNPDTAKSQVLSATLATTLNTAVNAQTAAVLLQDQIQTLRDQLTQAESERDAAKTRAERWQRAAINSLTPDTYDVLKARAEREDEPEVEASTREAFTDASLADTNEA